ncbi:hypothetical protein QAD02_022170 [Eretmocerus hayati]|uniref:Uncharacterized protein n=1 Tax=Eretmocerus hayati TaxID=131215 RepID=A0ACC2PS79_9HYME|nr:hypothetical protein QAD02_022170 [Eretmocerus hayati]
MRTEQSFIVITQNRNSSAFSLQAQHRIEQLKKATDRIQREIEEVTEREHELRNVGSIKTISDETVDYKVRRMPQALACSAGRLKRTTSTPQILESTSPPPPPSSSSTTSSTLGNVGLRQTSTNGSNYTKNRIVRMSNGVISTTRSTPQPLRFANTPSQKGLMHRFLATRGKLMLSPPGMGLQTTTPKFKNGMHDSRARITPSLTAPLTTTTTTAGAAVITLNPDSVKALNALLVMQQHQMSKRNQNPDTEEMLMVHQANMRKQPPSRNGYVPVEQKIQRELNEMRERERELRLMRSQMLAKSQPNLAELVNDNNSDIYESTSSMRSGTSTNCLNEDDTAERELVEKHKPHPRRRSNLIAQWESLIAKNEASEHGYENANTV